MPALLTKTDTLQPFSAKTDSTASPAEEAVKSTATTATSTECCSRNSVAKLSKSSPRRATRTKGKPSFARDFAKDSPIPAEAPVTTAAPGYRSYKVIGTPKFKERIQCPRKITDFSPFSCSPFFSKQPERLPKKAPPIVNGQRRVDLTPSWGWGQGQIAALLSPARETSLPRRIVLTAAHCGIFPLELVVQFGKAFFGRDSDDIDVAAALSDAAFHPDYEANPNASLTKYDAGILVLEEEPQSNPLPSGLGTSSKSPLDRK